MKDKKFTIVLIIAILLALVAIVLGYVLSRQMNNSRQIADNGITSNPSPSSQSPSTPTPAIPTESSTPATSSTPASPSTTPAPVSTTPSTTPIFFPIHDPIRITIWRPYFDTSSMQIAFNYPSGFRVTPNVPLLYAPLGAVIGTRIDYPASYSSGTNLGEVSIGIGRKTNVSDCASYGQVDLTTVINAVKFYKISTLDAGAGNFYETINYAAPYMGYCYNVYLFMHSSNINNYDPASGIKEFNRTDVVSVFENIMKSFKITIPT